MQTLNTVEAASVLKVHRKTVEDLINNGTIPAAKIGRSWVMLERDVLAYVTNQISQQTAKRNGITP